MTEMAFICVVGGACVVVMHGSVRCMGYGDLGYGDF